MDVTVWFPGSIEWFPIDVTVRFAGATRYVGSDQRPGTAAGRAEREKFHIYIYIYGGGVCPLALNREVV